MSEKIAQGQIKELVRSGIEEIDGGRRRKADTGSAA